MTPPAYPAIDESLDRLHRAGWSVGDAAFGPEHALMWLVTGNKGENAIQASRGTRAEAYWNACVQAREVGMLARAAPDGDASPAAPVRRRTASKGNVPSRRPTFRSSPPAGAASEDGAGVRHVTPRSRPGGGRGTPAAAG